MGMAIDTLLRFNTIKALTSDGKQLVQSFETLGSSLIELDEEKTKFKRKEAFDFDQDRKQANERSVFVEGFPPQEDRNVILVDRKAIVSKLEELGGGEVGFTLFKKSHMSNLYNGKVVVEFKDKKSAEHCIETYRQSANFYHQVKNERKAESVDIDKKEVQEEGETISTNEATSTKTDEEVKKEAYRQIQDKILAVDDWKTLPIIEVNGPQGQTYRIMIKPFDSNLPYYDKARGLQNGNRNKRKLERSSVSNEEDEKAQKRQKMKEERIEELKSTMLIIEDASKEAQYQHTKEALRTVIGGNGVGYIEFDDGGRGMARFRGLKKGKKSS